MEKLESIIFGLKAEVERLQGEKRHLSEEYDRLGECFAKLKKRTSEQKAEIERLKKHIRAKEIADEHVRKMRGTDLRTIAELQRQVDDYKRKIEQGTLKELPCKVGDTVYCVYAVSGIQEWEVMSIAIYDHDTVLRLGHKGTNDYNAAWLKEKGTHLFFNPEEAKQRLKEMKG